MSARPSSVSPQLRKLLDAVTGKRAKTVAKHILKHGSITTEDLRERYGYEHPPRAKQDLQEQGIPIETFFVKNRQDRRIAAYRFGNLENIRGGVLHGRKLFPKKFKSELVENQGAACAVCSAKMESRYLQIDHRIPYDIAGEIDADNRKAARYMLLCTSCNRAKSWSCEHCENRLGDKASAICESCYWANPATYKHVAMRDVRRLDLSWTGPEIIVYDELSRGAQIASQPLPEFVKKVLERAIGR